MIGFARCSEVFFETVQRVYRNYMYSLYTIHTVYGYSLVYTDTVPRLGEVFRISRQLQWHDGADAADTINRCS